MKKFLALFIWLLLAANAEAASRFWVGGTGTWDAADTTHWAATSGGAGGQSVPGSGDTVTFDASSGASAVVTINTNVNVQSITMGACTCTLDFSVNNNDVTLSVSFSGTGTGVRTLRLGNGTWTITATSGTNVWSIGTITNLTFAANSSTVQFTGVNKNITVNIGALTYNIISNASSGAIQISGVATITTFLNSGYISLGSSMTITNPISWNGTSSAPIGLVSALTGTTTITTSGTSTCNWCAFRGIIATGTFNAINSLDLANNTLTSITPPASGGSGGGIIGGL